MNQLTEDMDGYRRRATNPHLKKKLDIFLDIQYHALVALGLIVSIVAIVNLMDMSNGGAGSLSTDKALLDVGSALSCLSWALLALWALTSYGMIRRGAQYNSSVAHSQGKTVSRPPQFPRLWGHVAMADGET